MADDDAAQKPPPQGALLPATKAAQEPPKRTLPRRWGNGTDRAKPRRSNYFTRLRLR